MISKLNSAKEKLVGVGKRVGKGARQVAAATTFAVASLSSQAQTPPPIPEIPAASVEKQNSYNAMLPEGSKIGKKAASGQTELFYTLQTSPGNYVVDISQWSGLSIAQDEKLKLKIGHFDNFLRSLVQADGEFAKEKILYIGMSQQSNRSLNLRIPDEVIEGYKVIVVTIPTLNDDGNKLLVSVTNPDDGKFGELDSKVYDYENTKSGLISRFGGKHEVIEAIDSHPLRTIGAVSAGALGVLTLGGIAGAGLATRRKNKEVEFWKERSKAKGFYSIIDSVFRKAGIREASKNDYTTFSIDGIEYELQSHFDFTNENGGTVSLSSIGDGKYLMPNGLLQNKSLEAPAPTVSISVFEKFINERVQSSLASSQAGEGDMLVLSESLFQFLEIEAIEQANPRQLATLSKIETLMGEAGYVSRTGKKLSFLRTSENGTNAGSRISKFIAMGKRCEIYVDNGGMVQVTIDEVSTPNAHDVADFAQCEAALKSIFE